MSTVDIKRIFDTYEGELRRVEQSLAGLFKSNVYLIPLIGRYLIESGGKRLRPLFLLASARLAGYKGDDHIRLASIIESIHTASLLHDDIVDGAESRRGRSTAHSLWGNNIVVLVGDFLYSNALREAVSFKNQRIMDSLSEATTRMTEGELLQLEKSSDTAITEEEYHKIISYKTGLLISAACRIGGIISGLPEEKEAALAAYGLKAGIAFQMADDILDYMAEEDLLGKNLGKDLDEGKITLPLINLIAAASDEERDEIRSIVEDGAAKGGLEKILALFKRYDVLDKSMQSAGNLVQSAKDELLVFPQSEERDDLFLLADYALQRVK